MERRWAIRRGRSASRRVLSSTAQHVHCLAWRHPLPPGRPASSFKRRFRPFPLKSLTAVAHSPSSHVRANDAGAHGQLQALAAHREPRRAPPPGWVPRCSLSHRADMMRYTEPVRSKLCWSPSPVLGCRCSVTHRRAHARLRSTHATICRHANTAPLGRPVGFELTPQRSRGDPRTDNADRVKHTDQRKSWVPIIPKTVPTAS